MQRRHVAARACLFDGIDLPVVVAAHRRRAAIQRRREAVIFHARILDAVEGCLVLGEVQFRPDQPPGIAQACVHTLRDKAGQCIDAGAAVRRLYDDVLHRPGQLCIILPNTLAIVLAAPWRPQDSFYLFVTYDAYRRSQACFPPNLVYALVVEIFVGVRQELFHGLIGFPCQVRHMHQRFRIEFVQAGDAAAHGQSVHLPEDFLVAGALVLRQILFQIHSPRAVLTAL